MRDIVLKSCYWGQRMVNMSLPIPPEQGQTLSWSDQRLAPKCTALSEVQCPACWVNWRVASGRPCLTDWLTADSLGVMQFAGLPLEQSQPSQPPSPVLTLTKLFVLLFIHHLEWMSIEWKSFSRYYFLITDIITKSFQQKLVCRQQSWVPSDQDYKKVSQCNLFYVFCYFFIKQSWI